MKTQANASLFLRYWAGLWIPVALVVGLVANPGSTRFMAAAWNPAAWAGMLPVTGIMAWWLLRYGSRLKAAWQESFTGGIGATLLCSVAARRSWDVATRRANPGAHSGAVVLLLLAVIAGCWTVVMVAKRLTGADTATR